jgi:hypothetical protein
VELTTIADYLTRTIDIMREQTRRLTTRRRASGQQ